MARSFLCKALLINVPFTQTGLTAIRISTAFQSLMYVDVIAAAVSHSLLLSRISPVCWNVEGIVLYSNELGLTFFEWPDHLEIASDSLVPMFLYVVFQLHGVIVQARLCLYKLSQPPLWWCYIFVDDSPTQEYPFYIQFSYRWESSGLRWVCLWHISRLLGGSCQDNFWWIQLADTSHSSWNWYESFSNLKPFIVTWLFGMQLPTCSNCLSNLSQCTAWPKYSTVVPDSILLNTFPDFLTDLESRILREAIPHLVKNSPIDVLARFDCREIPTNKTIRAPLIRISHYELFSKPLTAVTLINSGIPSVHEVWWQSKSVDELHKVYMALTATLAKV